MADQEKNLGDMLAPIRKESDRGINSWDAEYMDASDINGVDMSNFMDWEPQLAYIGKDARP